MITRTRVAELLADTALQPHEAVAIVQSLIDRSSVSASDMIHEPYGPPCPDNIELGSDGSIACTGCAATPAVSEMAILLETLLPRGTPRVPGALRYAIARGLLEVEARPFDSLAEFSGSLLRFERGERADVIRALVARADAADRDDGPRLVVSRQHEAMVTTETVALATTTSEALADHDVKLTPGGRFERRHLGAERDQLRRELRALDAQLYEREVRRLREVPVPRPRPAPRRPPRFLSSILAFAATILVALSAYTHLTLPVPRFAQRAPAQEAAVRRPLAAKPLESPTPIATHAESRLVALRSSVDRGEEPLVDAIAPGLPSRQPDDEGALVRFVDVQNRPVFSPSFASNGSAVFFRSEKDGDVRSALMTADTVAGELRVITILDDGARNYHVQISPDGKTIAFDSDRDGERGVYVAERDGSNVHRVSGRGYAALPSWSPDGARLAFVRAERGNARVWNLWVLSLASGEEERVTDYPSGQTWSASWFPDGRRVAYAREDRLYVTDLVTDRTRSFQSPVHGSVVRTPAVSPDASHVVFQVHGSGAWLLDLADGSMRCVLADPTADDFAWAPDGRRVAFHSRRDEQWGIYVMAGR